MSVVGLPSMTEAGWVEGGPPRFVGKTVPLEASLIRAWVLHRP